MIPSINGIMYQLNALKTEINNNESTSSTSPAKEKEKPLPTPLAKVFLQRALYFAKTEYNVSHPPPCLPHQVLYHHKNLHITIYKPIDYNTGFINKITVTQSLNFHCNFFFNCSVNKFDNFYRYLIKLSY